MMEAIILAGGMGTRLQKVVTDVPKPMALVNGKPFLFYLLCWISDYPVEKIILSTGYMAEKIFDYFGNSFENIKLEYAKEEKPLGTGGAVIKALKSTKEKNILILNGDTWFPVNLNEFYSFHLKNNNIFSIALKRMKKISRYGSVETDGDTIVRFNEKRYRAEGLINGGIYLANRQFFESGKLPDVFSLEKELLAAEVGTSVLKGVVFDDPFIDIGVPEDYRRAGSVMKI
jgi:D-glycero-alpha-D-manno-heptose 1-phosphate guanylyltransferase